MIHIVLFFLDYYTQPSILLIKEMLPMENIVFQVISQVLEVPLNEITLESSSDTIESWDSLKHMNLILALEDEFDIQFSDDQIVKMLNVGLILEAIKEAKAL